MNRKLSISVCGFLHAEMDSVLKNGNYPDVELIPVAENCMQRSVNVNRLVNSFSSIQKNYSKSVFFVGLCSHQLKDQFPPREEIDIRIMDNCFDLIFPKQAVAYFIKQGGYILTSGWLKNFKKNIDHWGFDKTTARLFFKESAKKLILLETGVVKNSEEKIRELSEFLELPYEIIPVGLDNCRNYIDSIVNDWRYQIEKETLNKQLASFNKASADYAIIMKLLNTLVDLVEEEEILTEIFKLLELLFAPEAISFTPSPEAGEILYHKGKTSQQPIAKNSFSIKVAQRDEVYGVFELTNVMFPKFIKQYKSMEQSISQLSGLALSNARKYRELQKQREELKALNNTKDKFFSIIAHDLRSPFVMFMGAAELFSKQIYQMTFGELEVMSKQLYLSASKLFVLLENLLSWSRSNLGRISISLQKIIISDIINQTIDLVEEYSVKKAIEITNEVPKDVAVHGDVRMCEIILRNLLTNALKFTPDNGAVQIVHQIMENGFVRITVKDTGIGMNNELINKLFQMNADSGRKGTRGEASSQLGLILCKDFVERQGGEIWVESTEGKGSSFHFTLPLCVE